MSKKIYALFNSDAEVEKAVSIVTQLEDGADISVVHGKQAPSFGVAAVSPAGVYPNGVILPDGTEMIFELSDEQAQFVQNQLNEGMSLLVVDIENDPESQVLTSLREMAAYAFLEQHGLNLDQTSASGSDPVDTLNGLIALCHDGIEGYTAAAEQSDKEVYQRMFTEYADQRRRFVEELQTIVRDLGGDPQESGSFLGSLHEGWLRFRSFIAGGSQETHAILEEARRGEEAVLEAYKEAFHNDLPESVRPVIRNHLSEINVAYERMESLSNVTE